MESARDTESRWQPRGTLNLYPLKARQSGHIKQTGPVHAQVFARGQDEEQRGLTPGFLEGPQHQRLVRGRAPRHRGVLAGRVVKVDTQAETVTIDMLVGLPASTCLSQVPDLTL